jgi:hypothetical protein
VTAELEQNHMADEAHLNEFLTQETDLLTHALLKQFAIIARDQNVNPSEYPTRVRLLLDALFNGLIDATNHPDRS